MLTFQTTIIKYTRQFLTQHRLQDNKQTINIEIYKTQTNVSGQDDDEDAR